MPYFKNLLSIEYYLIKNKYNWINKFELDHKFYVHFIPAFNNFCAFSNLKYRFLRVCNVQQNYNPIAGIDLITDYTNKRLVIDYLMVYDKKYINRYYNNTKHQNPPINDSDGEYLKNILLNYSEKVGFQERCNKIERPIHISTMNDYQILNSHGYKLTNRICIDNPYWIVSEKKLF